LSDAALTGHGLHAAHHPRQMHHFDSMAQQKETATFGMWVFLVTEIMFFGGMFAAYMLYRMWYFPGFAAASSELDITLGGTNTVVLIASSLTVAMAVHAAQLGKRDQTVWLLIATGVLGLVFLVIKYFEYKVKFAGHHLPGALWGRHAHLARTGVRSASTSRSIRPIGWPKESGASPRRSSR